MRGEEEEKKKKVHGPCDLPVWNPAVETVTFVPVMPPRLRCRVSKTKHGFGKTSESQMFSAKFRGHGGQAAANSQFNPWLSEWPTEPSRGAFQPEEGRSLRMERVLALSLLAGKVGRSKNVVFTGLPAIMRGRKNNGFIMTETTHLNMKTLF